ncbi:hypothetical protein CRENBAI_013579 [Crenichthys baileyi]|uniref:Uncharacterized protein n=1 Tax=Crenichthys baileyi TaxID=28760 RepID=A0AAV9S4W6_9TELE
MDTETKMKGKKKDTKRSWAPPSCVHIQTLTPNVKTHKNGRCTLTLAIHTLYSKVQLPIPQRGNQPLDTGDGPPSFQGGHRQTARATSPGYGRALPEPERPRPPLPDNPNNPRPHPETGPNEPDNQRHPRTKQSQPPSEFQSLPYEPPTPINTNMNFPKGPPPNGSQISNTNAMNPLPTEMKTHRHSMSQAHSHHFKHLLLHPTPTVHCTAMARQRPCSTSPQPPHASTTKQTLPSPGPTLVPSTRHHDGIILHAKQPPAGSMHLGQRPQQTHITATAMLIHGEQPTSSTITANPNAGDSTCKKRQGRTGRMQQLCRFY